jgi:hypothetical protein
MTDSIAPAAAALAMQYRFVLPADYDMTIVERRIAEKGPLLDDFPNLKFKAYLWAARSHGAPENLYAPFYVWDNGAGMSEFLCGPGFAGVSGAFGWPSVKTWTVWSAPLSDAVAEARFATREIAPIAPYAALSEIRGRESEAAQEAVARGGAFAAVAAFEPTQWTLVRFRLWGERPAAAGEANELYRVGHLSRPEAKAAAADRSAL